MEASPAPAYLRIAAALRDRIAEGEWGPGALLPSERELSAAFGVSRMTARQAVGVLESEGTVYRRSPRGTFVAPPRLAMRIGSFSDEVVRLGHHPQAEVLWAEGQVATPAAAQALGLSEGERVHALQRLRRVDGAVVAIETTYFPERLTPGLLEQDLGGSLWSILRDRYGVMPSHATASLEVVVLDDVAAKRLGVRNAAAGILMTRRTFAGDRCFEFARDLFRADRVQFEVEASIP